MRMAGGRAGGLRDRAQLARTIAEAMHGARAENVEGLGKAGADFFEGVARGRFEGAMAGGRTGEAEAMLKQRAVELDRQGAVAMREKFTYQKAAVTLARSELDALEKRGAATDEIIAAQTKLNDAMEKTATMAHDIENIGIGPQEKLAGATFAAGLQRTLGGIGSIYGALPAGGQQEALGNQVVGMRAKQQALDAAIEELNNPDTRDRMGAAEQEERVKETMEARRANAAALAAAESPTSRYLARKQDDEESAKRRAEAESRAGAIGFTTAGQLLGQERSLRAATGGMNPQNDNDRVRLLVYENELLNTQEKIQERILEVQREGKQIAVDARREYERGLLFSSPGDLLRKLAVARLDSPPGGLTAGRFMSLSPEAKREYDALRGGERGAKNREEQRLLDGHGVSLEQEQERRAAMSARSGATRAAYAGGTGFGLDAMELKARAASASMEGLTGAAMMAAAALGQVVSAVQQMVSRAVAAALPAPGGSRVPQMLGYQY
jgi:hypothetical protein